MSDSTVFCSGTKKEQGQVVGGFGGGVVVNNNIPPLNPQPTNQKFAGGWHRSIGSLPKTGSWKLVAENAGWLLVLDTATERRKWRKLKLASKVVRAGGANFWLQWSGVSFGESAEVLRLVERFPEAEEWARAAMVAYDKPRLVDCQRMAANV